MKPLRSETQKWFKDTWLKQGSWCNSFNSNNVDQTYLQYQISVSANQWFKQQYIILMMSVNQSSSSVRGGSHAPTCIQPDWLKKEININNFK